VSQRESHWPIKTGTLGEYSRFWGFIRNSLDLSLKNAGPFLTTAATLAVIAHPLFYIIWRYAYPQPYENLPIRLVGSLLAVPFLFKDRWPEKTVRFQPLLFQITVVYNLPFVFSFFLIMNGFSQVWVLSTLGAAFVLTALLDWRTATTYVVLGTVLSGIYTIVLHDSAAFAVYLKYVAIFMFPLVFGGIFNFKLQRYRNMQREFEKRLRKIANQNAKMTQEQNQLLSFFLSNTIISRLGQLRKKFDLETALAMITGQEQRFCGMMEADIRNFTKMFVHESEIEVAQLVRRCFTEITDIGQDLTVIKPVGDSIFMYCDDKNGRENTVPNILALAIFFVHSVEEINPLLVSRGGTPLNFGIAVHAGEAIYGNLAADTLIDPTIIGINVNKTARLEELTKVPEVRNLIGINAIIISEEAARYGQSFISRRLLIPIHLDELDVHVRDFPNVKKVYGLPSEIAAAYFDHALERIQSQRDRLPSAVSQMEANTYHGIPYYFEMQGVGPSTSWTIMIDVSSLPARTIQDYALGALTGFDYKFRRGDGHWLILSTEEYPGEYDESDVEARIFKIIQELEQAVRPVHA